ncbi:hypothetical protein OV090_03680 [Nannocystis sp. RBIL2]|uniref:hypothetical protein n=1 Tax=Nannocystis sp. RBIL2 TaxID=2996788 RepID=UPI00226D4D41|nr:hypothetical protein [Nannocystis sp. RBIL2]MCY1063846.1 hypothetical protein [Nannocystis sp. RBIL2]
MRTRSLSAVFAVSTLFLSACGDRPLEDQPEDGCALDQPSLLVPLPAGWDPDERSSSLNMWVTDDHLLYAFDEVGQKGRFDLVPLCGGAPEFVAEKAPPFMSYSVMNSEQGPVLFKFGDYTLDVIDRLEVPGRDEVRRVGEFSLPPGDEDDVLSVEWRGGDFGTVYGFNLTSTEPDPVVRGVAGIGGGHSRYYFHSGDPDAPVVLIGDDIVRYYQADNLAFMLRDDGSVDTFDRETGEAAHILDGARYIESVWTADDHLHLLYQVMGDDASESVRIRDLGTGEEREVTVNDFAADSWGRGPTTGAGYWRVAAGPDTTVFALHGPDSRFVEAYRLDTLEPLAIPDHVGPSSFIQGNYPGFALVVPDPEDHVIAVWNALTGAMVEIYRGPEPDWRFRVIHDDGRVLYERPNGDGSMRRIAVDLASGETNTVIPRIGDSWFTLEDGRLLSRLDISDDEIQHEFEYALVDPDTGDYEVLVERTAEAAIVEGVGLLYLDLEASRPGIWTLPFPPR